MSCRRMANCLHFSIILALCYLQAVAELQEYGPFHEGLSETLTCSGPASVGKRSVYWRKIYPNASYIHVAECNEENNHHQCEASSPEYKITYSPTNDGFITNLTLPVSIAERNAAFKCSLFDYTIDSSRHIRSWNFSKTYHSPDTAVCRAARLDAGNIIINCSVQNIYPRFVCEMFEIRGDIELKVDATEIKYSPLSIDSRGYISGTCHVVRQVCHSGTYKYRAKIYPDVTLRDVETAVRERETETDLISSVPLVEVKQKSCSGGNKALVFTCTAYWLQKEPTFQWLVDNELVKDSNSSFIRLNEWYQFVSKIELRETISYNGKQIQCKVKNGIGTFDSEKKIIRQIWPTPQPPHFIKDGNFILGGSFTPVEGEQIDTFTCKVADEAKNVTRILVTCQLGAETLVNTEHYGASITFDINYTIARTHVCCKCSVSYITDCVLSTNLTISRLKPSPKWQPFDTAKVIAVTVAGVVLLILLIFLIGTLLLLKNHLSKMTTYVYTI
ncbi:hypothetical protein BsWGS_16694 [Bradybaena similaris]